MQADAVTQKEVEGKDGRRDERARESEGGNAREREGESAGELQLASERARGGLTQNRHMDQILHMNDEMRSSQIDLSKLRLPQQTFEDTSTCGAARVCTRAAKFQIR
eukprot:6186835-Pleurochrysis_carterae.AAC.3